MKSQRLRKQGFANVHRKLIIRVVSILLLAYLIYAPPVWHLPESLVVTARVLGTILALLGVLGRTFATLTIGGHKDRSVVRSELYSVSRNPLYFASFLIALGIGLTSGRIDFLILVAISYLAIFYPMMINEACYLRAKFADYDAYAAQVPLFLPNFRLWRERPSFEINFNLVRNTFVESSCALIGIPLILLIQSLV